MNNIIDAHIHLDMYANQEKKRILAGLEDDHVKQLVSVSSDLQSAKENLKLSQIDKRVRPAFGFHPEQEVPSDNTIAKLLQFIRHHQDKMVAIGEVGLPYYLRKDNPTIPLAPYVGILDLFLCEAKRQGKPVVLHAIYQDAPLVCDLLEKHTIQKAHFHWFKGDKQTLNRMKKNGYYLSITPDVLYETEIQSIVKDYPLELIMVETDGPWEFTGPFANQQTHPGMIHHSIKKIAALKQLETSKVYQKLWRNTTSFYQLASS